MLHRVGFVDKYNRSGVRKRAEGKVTERLKELRGRSIFRETHKNYTVVPEQNLISGVEKEDFWSDLGAGAGNELTDNSKGPAKFCAAFSSSALAVNVFGPFRNKPNNLEILDYTGFETTQFEKPLTTGLRGTDPHLDFYAQGHDQIVCIESKFLEPLWPKEAKFANSYEEAIELLAERSWTDVYTGLKSDPRQFKFLDAAQLVKHYLGMRNTLDNLRADLILLYIYWEPTNATDLNVFRLHREEVARLSEAVVNSSVKFVAQSYGQLWAKWKSTSLWSGVTQHVANLEERYAFSI